MQLSSRCPEVSTIKKSSMDREAIEELSRRQEISRSIHLAIERCRDCDKNHLNSSTDSLAVEQLSSFKKSAFLHLFLGQICMASILDLNSCSLKY